MNFSLSQIEAVTCFIEPFENPDFRFSVHSPPVQNKDGYWVSGHDIVNPVGLAFRKSLIDNGWGAVNFDWSSFVSGDEYHKLMKDPDGLEKATPEQIAKILTSILRRDRFSDGWFVNSFNDGTILRILKRLQTIANTCRDAH